MKNALATITLATLLLAALPLAAKPMSHAVDSNEITRWQQASVNTSITRDNWGIAHIHGKSDADTVFGMAYAQAEDDFNRVETNYLTALGRLAEASGESAIDQDLRMRLFINPTDLKKQFQQSPAWLKKLMVAWADGLNCFLTSHPDTAPKVLKHFEPWMALSFSEGSIGGDIERVALAPLHDFYRPNAVAYAIPEKHYPREPSGSNGIAIAPSISANGHALLLINPHTSFFFRSELQATSDEGLNAYGAVTWGQFFIYQGFNEHLGWMHTSSGIDNVDFFKETIVRKNGAPYYRYGSKLRALKKEKISLSYRTAAGGLNTQQFTVYKSHHGPVIGQIGKQWLTIALMQKPIEALSQSFLLTKAKNYAEYMKVMELKANSSNNTIYADAAGNIAYLHPQFIPKRNDRFDYTHPVDGADPATDWKGLHGLSEAPHLLNPSNGWIMNTNNWPYSAAGEASPKQSDYPRYMDTAGENPRGLHATLVLKDKRGITQDSLNAIAFDPYLPAFARLIPSLIKAYDSLDAQSAYKSSLSAPVAALRTWDYRWSVDSIETTLAVLWGDELWDTAKQDADAENVSVYEEIADHTSADQKLAALKSVWERLERDFGTWKVGFGLMNRFQRRTADITQDFSDSAPSVAIPFASARWGSLASFGAHRYPGTNKYYGTSGNSFVAIVEFGSKISARAVSIGGESGDPTSVHFSDQTLRYAQGALRPVYFYPSDLEGKIEREYHPQ